MIEIKPRRESLRDFQTDPAAFLKRVKACGQPVLLAADDQSEFVVQDAATYEQWLEVIDRAEAIVGIRLGLDSLQRGEGRPLEEVFEELRVTYEVPDSNPAVGDPRD